MTNFFTLRTIAYALVCFVGILFTGCGGSSSGGGSAAGGNTTQLPTPTLPPQETPTPTPYPSLKPTPTPSPTNPPPALPDNGFGISAYAPSANTSNWALVGDIKISFSKALIPATALAENVSLIVNDTKVAFELEFDGTSDLVLKPIARLTPNATYTVEVYDSLMSEEGDTLEETRWQFTTSANLGDTPQSVIDSCMAKVDIDLLAAVNDVRTSGYSCQSGDFAPAAPLRWSCALGSAAYRHSVDMATNNFHQHTGSDGSDHSLRITQAGYDAIRSAENLALGHPDVSRAMLGWLQSELGHCENIMNPRYVDFGSALVTASPIVNESGRYWTQNFAEPAEDTQP